MYKDKKRIIKNGYVVIEDDSHHKRFDTGTGMIGVYEHVLIAEQEVLGRRVKEGEVIHHLDGNRSNNSPENLAPMYNTTHAKLHKWLDKHTIIPNQDYLWVS